MPCINCFPQEALDRRFGAAVHGPPPGQGFQDSFPLFLGLPHQVIPVHGIQHACETGKKKRKVQLKGWVKSEIMGFKIWTVLSKTEFPFFLSCIFSLAGNEHYKILHGSRNWVWKYTIYENVDPELILVDFVAKVKLFCCSCWECRMEK